MQCVQRFSFSYSCLHNPYSVSVSPFCCPHISVCMFVILPALSLTLNPVHCVQFCFLYMSDSVFPSCLHFSECEFPFVPCWFVGLFICSSIYIELQQNKISDNIRQEGVYDGMLDTQYLSEFIAVSQYDNNNRIFV